MDMYDHVITTFVQSVYSYSSSVDMYDRVITTFIQSVYSYSSMDMYDRVTRTFIFAQTSLPWTSPSLWCIGKASVSTALLV